MIDLFLLIVLLIVAARLIPAALSFWRIYAGISGRRLEDASAYAPPMAPPVAAVAQRLASLGFTRIGERSAVLPGLDRRFEWNLVDEPSTTYVSLAPSPGVPGIYMASYTAFADGDSSRHSGARPRRSTARYLRGARRCNTRKSVAEHRRRIEEFAALHGPPLPNRSMADLLVRDGAFRRRHGGITLRRRVYGMVGLTAMVTIAAAIQLIRVVTPS